NAERTELIAPLLNGQECGCSSPSRSLRELAELVLIGEFGVDKPPALRLCLGSKDRQSMVSLRANYEIDHRRAGNDLRSFGLGDTAGNGHHGILALDTAGVLQLPNTPKL